MLNSIESIEITFFYLFMLLYVAKFLHAFIHEWVYYLFWRRMLCNKNLQESFVDTLFPPIDFWIPYLHICLWGLCEFRSFCWFFVMSCVKRKLMKFCCIIAPFLFTSLSPLFSLWVVRIGLDLVRCVLGWTNKCLGLKGINLLYKFDLNRKGPTWISFSKVYYFKWWHFHIQVC